MPSVHNHNDQALVQQCFHLLYLQTSQTIQPQCLLSDASIPVSLAHPRTKAMDNSSQFKAVQPPKQCREKELCCWGNVLQSLAACILLFHWGKMLAGERWWQSISLAKGSVQEAKKHLEIYSNTKAQHSENRVVYLLHFQMMLEKFIGFWEVSSIICFIINFLEELKTLIGLNEAGEILCNWEAILSTIWDIFVCWNMLKIQFNSLKIMKTVWISAFLSTAYFIGENLDANQERCMWNPQYYIFSWPGICITLMENMCNWSVQIWDSFQTLHVCLRLFWDIQKFRLKTEMESERYENKNLKFDLEEKSSNYAKNGNLCWILSQTFPLFLQMAWIYFNSWSRRAWINYNSWSNCLSEIFSQINNFKRLELEQGGILRLAWATFICNDDKMNYLLN